MVSLLETNAILMHPFVVSEIALGHLPRRAETLFALQKMRMAEVADTAEVLLFIEHNKIFGTGIGYVDAHLLVATMRIPETCLWTRDKRLRAVAERLSLAADMLD